MRIGSKLKNYLKNSSLNDSGKIFICVCLIICITINFLKVNSFGKDLDLKSKSAVLIMEIQEEFFMEKMKMKKCQWQAQLRL